ncbi:MAG TPA: nitrilase-related carbon-nitrogen hydrolase [Methylomirabilota bacterium]|jgi:predicted amidohydrolase|nr:nitrilase-related carbon-nitrogen hydrolase [Methylomirabilota bacterium]
MKLTVATVQLTSDDRDKARVVEKACRMIDEAGGQGADLIVLPEVWTGLGYSDAHPFEAMAEPIPGPTTDALSALARRHGAMIVGSLYEKTPDGRYFNSAPFIDRDGAILGCYRKTHLFDAPHRPDIPPGLMESKKVAAGDDLPVFETDAGKVGAFVCSDLRFPEIARVLALKGARVLVCCSAFLSPRLDHWEFFLRARACENQVFVVASGQYGCEPASGIAFVGRSAVIDPWGVIVATAPDRECVTVTTIDLDQIDEVKYRYPLMLQRRPELYGLIGQ